MTRQERFWSQVDRSEDGCWLWTGPVNGSGYGSFGNHRNGTTLVHRLAYEWCVGPIPEGAWIDHVREAGCISRLCVRPSHLEAVMPRVNILRGDTLAARHAAKTHCIHGHEFTPENTWVRRDGARCCRACNRENQARIRSRRLEH